MNSTFDNNHLQSYNVYLTHNLKRTKFIYPVVRAAQNVERHHLFTL